ncbi:hypothetical protein HON52_04860 [Candidatus Uhrbacteria bacterium]|nr:hypothetical protein [Candidatus Uhrbacteria bacterium]
MHRVHGLMAFILAAFAMWGAPAYALPEAGFRLLIHSSVPLTENIGLAPHAILSPNLAKTSDGLTPVAVIELTGLGPEWMGVRPTVGYAFGSNEVITALRLYPNVESSYGWFDFEVQPQSWSFYAFGQWERKLTDYIHIGAEYEGYGGLTDFAATSSVGAGPNILLRSESGYFGLDTTVRVRFAEDGAASETFVRVHLFL